MPELALRFDLTVPLARYVAEHEHDLAFPFRRYQMQRVYRGERAQRGRFREFYQCDIDVIGKDALSLRFDAEIPAVIAAVFERLAIGEFTIQLNNRKLLRGFFEGLGIDEAKRRCWCCASSTSSTSAARTPCATTLAGEGFGLAAEVDRQADGVRRRCARTAMPMRWPSSTRWARARRCSTKGATSCAQSSASCRRWACRSRATR